MKPLPSFISLCAGFLTLVAVLTVSAGQHTADGENLQAACQTEAQWQDLFNGDSLQEWELLDSGPASWIDTLAFWRRHSEYGGWTIDQQGNLYRRASAGDLRSRRQFANFELKLEWKISAGGNSGIKLRVADEGGKPSNTGFEMQILDNAQHKDGNNALTSAGALYGLYPSAHPQASKPVGEWNQVHIRVNGKQVMFSLNGLTTVRTEIGTPDWQQRLSKAVQRDRVSSRFAQFPKGHILLQDHFDDVWFRNIELCQLPSDTPPSSLNSHN